jgi:hypothetical protein
MFSFSVVLFDGLQITPTNKKFKIFEARHTADLKRLAQ